MYLPYPGIFNKMKNADLFVFLDDAQYTNTYFYNRNKIKTPRGELLLTVPIINSFGQKLNEVKIENNIQWSRKHLKSLYACYSKSKYFVNYIDFFHNIYAMKWELLHDLNLEILIQIMKLLDIETPLYYSSKLNLSKTAKTQRLIDICETLGADIYLSGPSGKDYLDKNLFEKHGIKLEFQNYYPKEYPQLWGSYIPNLSIIDMLFNVGDNTKELL
ncbi:MAG: WbqC family protein [Candidatus Methanoperedens sp.]|nr:WbqC family protein [Candidatus Methanoperedens sp.]